MLLLLDKAYNPEEPRDKQGKWAKFAFTGSIPESTMEVLKTIREAGGRPYLIGGAARDVLLGKPSKDQDIEVFGLPSKKLIAALGKHGKVDAVGQSFGVYKLRLKDGTDLDIAIPRSERKTAEGHRGFDVKPNPRMNMKTASSRRDFTVNALMVNPFTNEVYDFHGGIKDIKERKLRHIGPAFAEDPLRVLRAMQFAGRFGMELDPETAKMAIGLKPEYHSIAKERIWTEWEKLLTKAAHPGKALEVLSQSGWLDFYPELKALQGIPQEPHWHPEGDAWTHTLFVADEAARIAERDGIHGDQRAILMLAAICHDLGKAVPGVTRVEERHGVQRITSPGHAEEGVPPTEAFLKRIGCPLTLRAPVLALVREHMAHTGVQATPRNVRRLASRLDPVTIREWERIVEADHSGRPPLPKDRPAKHWIDVAESLGAGKGKEKPVIGGDMLIARGLKPGPGFKPILDAAYDAQLEGDLTVGNRDEWLDRHLAQPKVMMMSIQHPLFLLERSVNWHHREEVKHPGVRGGRGFRDQHGHWHYGEYHHPGPSYTPSDIQNVFQHFGRRPAEAKQPWDTKEEIYAHAPEARRELFALLDKACRHFSGVKVYRPGKKPHQGAFHNPGTFIQFGKFKGVERASQKVESDYDGHWDKLLDVVRATVAVDDVPSLWEVSHSLKDAGATLARTPKNRFISPAPGGYRDALLNIRLKNGMIVEVQLHLKPILSAKAMGHKHYETIRGIEAALADQPEGRMTGEQVKQFHAAMDASNKLYGAAWDKAKAPTVNKSMGSPNLSEHKYYRMPNGQTVRHRYGSQPEINESGGWHPLTRLTEFANGARPISVSEGRMQKSEAWQQAVERTSC